MAPKKEVYCKKCNKSHARPVGRKCSMAEEYEEMVSKSDVVIDSTPDPSVAPAPQSSALDQILQKLHQIETKQEHMAAQVLRLESERIPPPQRASTPTRE